MQMNKQTQDRKKRQSFQMLIAIMSVLVCVAFILFNPSISYAASAEVAITSDTTEYHTGDEIYVYITLKSNETMGDFEANLSYDEDILEYKTGSPTISGGSGYLKISDIHTSDGTYSKKYVMMFTALSPGTITISLGDRAKVFDYDFGDEMSVSSNSLTLTIAPLVTASENSSLKSLKVSPSALEPEFSSGVYEYKTSVAGDVNKLVISALAEDEKSKVSIKGNDNLKDGDNIIQITVKAETGKETVYTINCFKEATITTEPNEEDLSINDKEQTKSEIEVVVKEDGQYLMFEGSIKLIDKPETVEIPKGYIKTRMIISGVSIPVYTLEKDLENDFLLIYGQYDEEEACFYRYDRAQKTLQRYEGGGVVYSANTIVEDNAVSISKYKSNLTKAAIVIALLSAICVMLLVVIIRICVKKQNVKPRKR